MRVVVPTWTIDASKGGIKTYLTNVVEALQRQRDIELVLLCDEGSAPIFRDRLSTGCTTLRWDLPGPHAARPLAEQIIARRLDRHLGDVLLVPSNVGYLCAGIPQVVVVQAPLAVPSIRTSQRALSRPGLAHRAYHRALLGPSLRRAGAVVAVSEWVRTELLQSFPDLDPSHVVTVHEGVAPPPVAARAECRQPGLLLFVSTLFPYKGADLFIEALSTLSVARPDVEWRARLVGRDPTGGPTTSRLRALAEQRGLAGRVDVTGPVPHDQIWAEYERAEVFVYPSRLETFGLPPLEAMAMGTPVVVSDAPPLAEVVGDAGLVVDPTDANEFATALARLLDSRAERQRLRDAGMQRVRELTWDSAAAHLRETLRHVAVQNS